MKSVLSAVALLLVGQAAFAMPHDQPVREVYQAGKIQVQVYRSEGLSGAQKGDAAYRAVESILVCKSGKKLKTFTTVREIGSTIVGLSKTGGVVLTFAKAGISASIETAGLKVDSKSVTISDDLSGINGFEIKSDRFGECAKSGDRDD